MKRFTLFVLFVVIIAGGLFFRQVLDAIRGMSVLEAMQQAISFVLHVVVVSILGYGAYMLNELVQPWIKTFRQKQRHHRRQIRGRRVRPAAAQTPAAAPRSRKDTNWLWIISQLAQHYQAQSKQRSSTPRTTRDRIRF